MGPCHCFRFNTNHSPNRSNFEPVEQYSENSISSTSSSTVQTPARAAALHAKQRLKLQGYRTAKQHEQAQAAVLQFYSIGTSAQHSTAQHSTAQHHVTWSMIGKQPTVHQLKVRCYSTRQYSTVQYSTAGHITGDRQTDRQTAVPLCSGTASAQGGVL